jgi:hypothetical protein
MTEIRCDQCNEVYQPRRLDQRFCCKQCSDGWWAAQRTRGIELLRNSYGGRAMLEAAENPDRYAAVNGHQLSALPVSACSQDPCGPEPFHDGSGEGDRLGFAIDAGGSRD